MDTKQRKGFMTWTMISILMSRELEQLVFSSHSGRQIVSKHHRINLVISEHFLGPLHAKNYLWNIKEFKQV